MANKGANKGKCETYRRAGKRISNKIRKITKHLGKHPNDKIAIQALSLTK